MFSPHTADISSDTTEPIRDAQLNAIISSAIKVAVINVVIITLIPLFTLAFVSHTCGLTTLSIFSSDLPCISISIFLASLYSLVF